MFVKLDLAMLLSYYMLNTCYAFSNLQTGVLQACLQTNKKTKVLRLINLPFVV